MGQRFVVGGGIVALLVCGSVCRAAQVTIEYETRALTIVGTPFGVTVPFQTPVSGTFTYETTTADILAQTTVGHYPHVLGGGAFTANFLGNTITGSATPFVEIENLNPDTFRFIDGPRSLGNQGGIMSLNGTPDADVRLFMAFTDGSGGAFSNDALPNPLPFAVPPLSTGGFPHTFSLSDDRGTMLLQFTRIAMLQTTSAPLADAGPDYAFNFNNFSGITLNGTASQDDPPAAGVGDLAFAWSTTSVPNFATGVSPTLALTQTSITGPGGSDTITLTVTDPSPESGSDSDTATVTYNNAAPTSLSISGVDTPGPQVQFNATYRENDLVVNSSISNFEQAMWEFDTSAATSVADFASSSLTGANVSGMTAPNTAAALQTIAGLIDEASLGGPGTYQIFFNVKDRANEIRSTSFSFTLGEVGTAVPEPSSLALWGVLGLAMLGVFYVRRSSASTS
jgi:hypothetical protein